MAGNKIGGAKAAKTNKERFGEDYYQRIGKIGGAASSSGGFGQGEKGRELARRAGVLGGQASRRKKQDA